MTTRQPPGSRARAAGKRPSISAAAIASPLGIPRARCAFPIRLTSTRIECQPAFWTHGSPTMPFVRFQDTVYRGFESTLDAMVRSTSSHPEIVIAEATSTGKRRKIASAKGAAAETTPAGKRRKIAPHSLDEVDAHVVVMGTSSSEEEDDDNNNNGDRANGTGAPFETVVPLLALLDSVTGRDADRSLVVSRNADWVRRAETERAISGAGASVAVARTEMERIMRRIGRIITEVEETATVSTTVERSASGRSTTQRGGRGRRTAPAPGRRTKAPTSSRATVAKPPKARAVITIDSDSESGSSSSASSSSSSEEDDDYENGSTVVAVPPRTAVGARERTARTSGRNAARPTRTTAAVATAATAAAPPTSNSVVPRNVYWKACVTGDGQVALECSICMRDDGRALWHGPSSRVATLDEVRADVVIREDMRLADDALVANPCTLSEHVVCVGCMRTILLNAGRPPVGFARANVGCVSMDGESRCPTTSYHDARTFSVILNVAELAYVADLYERHRFQGMEVVVCPLQVAIERPTGRRASTEVALVNCGAQCMVDHRRAVDAERGHLVVTCTQNPQCGGAFCYHCRGRLTAASTRCGRCTRVCERDNPHAANRYFCHPALLGAPARVATDGSGDGGGDDDNDSNGGAAPANQMHLLCNRQVTCDLAVDQIERVLAMDIVTQPCYRCGVPLLKSTECNGLTHCGVEKCYMCGRNGLVGGHIESDHWDSNGRTGCPRYNHNAYWRRAKVPFVCAEGQCYTDASECTVPEHREGIAAMHAERRVWHVWGMLASLPHDLCRRALDRLIESTGAEDVARRALLDRVAKIVLPSSMQSAADAM